LKDLVSYKSDPGVQKKIQEEAYGEHSKKLLVEKKLIEEQEEVAAQEEEEQEQAEEEEEEEEENKNQKEGFRFSNTNKNTSTFKKIKF